MSSRWKAPPTNDEASGAASSISDAFANVCGSFLSVFCTQSTASHTSFSMQMLTVNEDLIEAAAECQAERDVQGLIAYQRVLHRDLMEMAEFIDAMFGVYSNSNSTDNGNSSSVAASVHKKTEQSPVVDLTAESAEVEPLATQEDKMEENKEVSARKASRGALLKAIEAGEKVRETQRSKEMWIKSRHRVLKEEDVSAMSESASAMPDASGTKSGENAEQEGSGGLALANQLRAHHQHIAAFEKASTEAAAADPPPPSAPTNLFLANPLAMPPLVVPGSFPPTPPFPVASAEQQLPLAHAYNMFVPFAPLMFNANAAGAFMPIPTWQPSMLPPRPTVPAKTPEFKRMCASCRQRHFSVRQCRLVFQHTDPEWQPSQSTTPKRRRKRKQSTTNNSEQIT